jgi:hypothetical protein
MKYLKALLIVALTVFTFGSAFAQDRAGQSDHHYRHHHHRRHHHHMSDADRH